MFVYVLADYKCVRASRTDRSCPGRTPRLFLSSSFLFVSPCSFLFVNKHFRPIGLRSELRSSLVSGLASYSDEATPAGILSSLKGCTRLLAPDEGDEVFRDLGLTQSYVQGGRVQTSFANARSKLTSLYDRPQEFVQQLKGQEVKVEMHAKLNILVGVELPLRLP